MRLVVPNKLRNYIIKMLHNTHLGITKTVAMAKQLFYWPGMKNDIQNDIESCNMCIKFSRSNIKEPMKCHDIPELPFNKICMDIAQFQGKYYLIVNGYLSRWLEVEEIKTKTAYDVINKLKKMLSRFGIPQIIVADNDPFNSIEFLNFCK